MKQKKPLLKSKFFSKLKSIKNIKLIFAFVLGAVLLLVYYSSSLYKSDTVSQNEYQEVSSYTQSIERKLQQVLSSIDGAGKVEVMVGFDSGLELVVAYSTETKTTTSNASGGKSETTIVVQTPVLVNEKGTTKPIVLKEKLPIPQSVVIVASGANDIKVKLNLIKAAQTTLGVESGKIEVFVGNQ